MIIAKMQQLFAVAFERGVFVEAFEVLLVLAGLRHEHALAVFQPEGVDVLVVLPEVLGSAQVEYDLVDVLCVAPSLPLSVMAAQSARNTP